MNASEETKFTNFINKKVFSGSYGKSNISVLYYHFEGKIAAIVSVAMIIIKNDSDRNRKGISFIIVLSSYRCTSNRKACFKVSGRLI